jgi:uncharacterized delta-60 repeat protein
MSKQSSGQAGLRHAIRATVLALALLLAPAAQARVGILDPSFGEGGRVTTQLENWYGAQMVIAPDGSIALMRGGLLARFLPGGEPDLGFGAGGELTLPAKIEDLELSPGSIAIDSQGRMLLFGEARDPSQKFVDPVRVRSAPASWAVVLRLRPDGQLDPTFGEGRGFIRSDFGLRSELETDLPLVRAASGRVDSQDRPIFIARLAGFTGRCYYGDPTITAYPRAVVRLTQSGSPDATFGGGDGISPIEGAEAFPYPMLALDGADQPAVAVGNRNCRAGGSRVIRLDAGGAPLAGFGAAGARAYPGLALSLVEPSGAMFLREGEPTSQVVKVGIEGNPDLSFGRGGKATVEMPRGAHRSLSPVAVDAEGRILLAGTYSLPAPPKHKHGKRGHHRRKRRPTRTFVAITRLLPTGEVDRSFGNQGWVRTRFSSPNEEINFSDAALDPQGRLVVAVVSVSTTPSRTSRLILARYLLD